jgi:thiamine-phosphate pyrophosphorylase
MAGKMFFDAGIYPVITSKLCKSGDALKTLREVLDCGVPIVQLREKEFSKKQIYSLAAEFKKLCEKTSTLLIINDHTDIALSLNAHGVHLGQDDLPLIAAKKIAQNLIIGISTHNLEEALLAQDCNADYINIGPIFETKTKELSYPPLGIKELVRIAKNIKIPFTVMGGIKEHNLGSLLDAGAKRFAMVTEITMADDIAEKIKNLKLKIAAY